MVVEGQFQQKKTLFYPTAVMVAITFSLWAWLSAIAAEAPTKHLAFSPVEKEFHFDTGLLQGTLREGGRSLGLGPVRNSQSKKLISSSMGLCSPYRLLATNARYETDAWDWPSTARLLPDGAVEVHWPADAEHPFELKAVYRLAAADTLDFLATVTAKEDLRKFEVFLASYFNGFPRAFAYVQEATTDGKPGFVEAGQEAGHWQCFPCRPEGAQLCTDGRWLYPPSPVSWSLRQRAAAPLALRYDAESGLTALVMALTEDCFAVAMPYGDEPHRSLYLSLFGKDISAGETASARARLIIRRHLTAEQAVKLYEAYAEEVQE